MSSPQDEHPRCTDVYASEKLRHICTDHCTAHRPKRREGDNLHCFQQMISIIGKVGECMHTHAELEAMRINLGKGV
jgi:hypothetical protein